MSINRKEPSQVDVSFESDMLALIASNASESLERSIRSFEESEEKAPMIDRLLHHALARGERECVKVLLELGGDPCVCYPISLSAPPTSRPGHSQLRGRGGSTWSSRNRSRNGGDTRASRGIGSRASRERMVSGRQIAMMKLWADTSETSSPPSQCLRVCLDHGPLGSEGSLGEDLIFAARLNRIECCKLLLRAKSDPNARDGNYSNTPLMIAAMSCLPELMNVLLEGGADVHLANGQGETALHKLVSKPIRTPEAAECAEQCAILLTTNGIDVNARNKFGETALMKMASRSSDQLHIVPVLLDAMREVDNSPKCKQEDGDMALKGIEESSHYTSGSTAIHAAARMGNTTLLKMLLTTHPPIRSLHPGVCDDGRNTPLHVAGDMQHTGGAMMIPSSLVRPRLGCLELLLEHKADPCARNDAGETPLHSNAGQCTAEFLSALVRAGASPHALDDAGQRPLDIALHSKSLACTCVLLDLMRPEESAHNDCEDDDKDGIVDEDTSTLLHCAAKSERWASYIPLMLSQLPSLKKSIDAREPIDGRDRAGYGALHHAIVCGNIIATKALLHGGANPMLPSLGTGETALDIAIRLCCISSLTAIVASHPEMLESSECSKAPLDIHTIAACVVDDEEGHTLLHRAVMAGDEDAVLFCLKTLDICVDAPCVGQRDDYAPGGTPLHVAAAKGDVEMTSLLIRHGANVDAIGGEFTGSTPAHIVAQYDMVDVLDTLLVHGSNPLILNATGQSVQEVALSYTSQRCMERLRAM